MSYKGRNAARREHKLAIREAAVKKRIDIAVHVWENLHPPRIHPNILSPDRFVDCDANEQLAIFEMPPPCRDSPPQHIVPAMPSMRWRAIGGDPMSMNRVCFRLVVWKLRADQSEIRWFAWEPMNVDGDGSDKERYPRAAKALAYIGRFEHVLNHLGLLGTRPLLHDHESAYNSWAYKELGEVIEILRLELGAWLEPNRIPAVREGVAASPIVTGAKGGA
jgi:hypothetical protein